MQNISLDGTVFKTMTDPSPSEEDITNVKWKRTADGGKERSVKIGESVRKRGYRIFLDNVGQDSGDSVAGNDEALFDAFIASLNGYSDTFTLVDHNGDSFTSRVLAPPSKFIAGPSSKFADIEFLEVLT